MDARRNPRACAAALVLGILVASAAQPALAADVRTDPANDADGDGPEITRVTVERDGGAIAFAVTFVSDPPLTWSGDEGYTDSLMIFASLDPIGADGAPGDGFAVGVHAATLDSGATFVRFEDGVTGPVEHGVADFDTSGEVVTLRVPAEVVGDADRFYLLVAAGREGEGVSGGDSYPSDGTWASFAMADLGAGFITRDLVVGGIVATGVLLALALAVVAYRRPRAAQHVTHRPPTPV